MVGAQGKQLLDHHNSIAPHKVVGDGQVFTRRFGGTGAEGKELDLARPADVGPSFQGFMPPGFVYLIVIVRGDQLLELFAGMFAQEDLIEPVSLPEFGTAGFFEQFPQYP